VQEARSQLSPVGRFRVLSSSPVSRSSLGRISTKVRNFPLVAKHAECAKLCLSWTRYRG